MEPLEVQVPLKSSLTINYLFLNRKQELNTNIWWRDRYIFIYNSFICRKIMTSPVKNGEAECTKTLISKKLNILLAFYSLFIWKKQ